MNHSFFWVFYMWEWVGGAVIKRVDLLRKTGGMSSEVGIINTQYISVLERTQQIGLMKALGMRGRHVLRLFQFEAAWIGLIGGTLGALAAIGFVKAFVPVAIGLTTTALGTLLPILREQGMLSGPFGRVIFAAGAAGELLADEGLVRAYLGRRAEGGGAA